MTPLVDAAVAWYDAGASVLPAQRDKRPSVDWKGYQTERIDRSVLAGQMERRDGFGIVTGYNGYEMLELEGRAAHLFVPLITALGPLAAKLLTYVETTPSGGYHFVYKYEGDMGGSAQLARIPDSSVPAGFRVLIETRGKYAWTIMAPSGGAIHVEIPNGQWKIQNGQPGVVATLTEEERETLFDACRDLDQMPIAAPVEHREALGTLPGGELSPGQAFEAQTRWEDILVGWKVWRVEGEKVKWCRPGKKYGTSATTNYDGNDNLYVFSSSTEFPANSSWTKFGAYAYLNHGGDYAKAASELRSKGFGTPQPVERILTLIPGGYEIGQSFAQAHEQVAAAHAEEPTPLPVRITATLTDDGNAQMLVDRYHQILRYSPSRKRWVEWTGSRWEWADGPTPAVQAMREIVRGLKPTDDAERKHKIRSLSWAACDHALKYAQNDPEMQIRVDELDALPYALNTPAGVVDLLTSVLSPPTPDGLHTLVTGVSPDFDASCPKWLRFLAETFQNAKEPAKMIGFIQRLAGYSATGKVTWHVLPFLHGTGANGKSVLMEVFQALLGSYAGTAPADLLLVTGKEDLAAQAGLSGKRFVVCSEVGPTAKFHEERAKRLTGGDRIAARFLYENYFEFSPTHHLWIHGNHQPQVPTGGGDSFWRRLDLVPFNHTVEEEDQNESLGEELVAEEGPAILAWLIEGARLQLEGLVEPAEVKMATSEYAAEEDALGRFLDECVRRGGGDFVRVNTKAMRAAYESWCSREGIRNPLPTSPFGREMKSRGIESKPGNGQRWYLDVTLLNSENPADLIDDSPRQTSWNDR